MNKHLYLVVAMMLAASVAVSAQHGKILNKDFAIDEYNSVEFELYGETHFEQWEADYILVETTVKLWDTPKQVFTNHINGGRYKVELKSTNDNAKIRAVPVPRNKLPSESVISVVYYPNSFTMNDTKIIRQEPVLTSKEEKK